MNYYAIGLVYEGIIIIISLPIVFASLRNYFKNKTSIALFLFLIFLFFILSIFFSWYSKFLSLFSSIDYIIFEDVPDPNSITSWILLRISYYRISFLLISNAIFFSYFLKARIFNIKQNKISFFINILYNGFNIFFSLIFFIKEVLILDLIIFLSVFGYMALIYFPFMVRAYKAYKIASLPNFKKAFLLLFLMALSYILVLLCLTFDQYFIYLGSYGFTIFYFISWIFVLFGGITGYLGYLKMIKN